MSSTQTSDSEVRAIEAAELSTRFARGWHCLGLVRDFADGAPHTVQAFDGKLVVFAGEDGQLNVLDAFCRHMGGDLSQGTVKGNEIACPFHDWRWGGDGRCKQIPYARRVPLRSRTQAWPTFVQDGQLFIWNDPEGNPPSENVTVPAIRGLDDGEWTDWTWDRIEVGTNCRELIDNVVDMAHFFYVHRGFPTYFKNVFEGHVATQFYEGRQRDDLVSHIQEEGEGQPKLLRTGSEAAYYGPSYMIDYLTHEFEDRTSETVLINCHYPIDNDRFVLQYGLRVKKQPGMSAEAAEAVAQSVGTGVKAGFLQDVEIWKNKARIDNPLLCEEDGPVYQLRRWYEQFYVDVEDVAPEMVDRFEFEIDTTRAVEAWEREVAENIARRDAARV